MIGPLITLGLGPFSSPQYVVLLGLAGPVIYPVNGIVLVSATLATPGFSANLADPRFSANIAAPKATANIETF